jgi:predicted DNA-binding ribbon-helix-helix protein
MTIRLPDDKHQRLKQLAKSRQVSINKLVEELATSVLSAHDAEVRFRALALRGNPKKALALLDQLDKGR